MRQIIKFGFGLVVSGCAFSATPVQGVYLGLFGEVSRGPSSAQLSYTFDQPYSGTIEYQPAGGGLAVSVGYRIKNFRVEAELLANTNRYGSLVSGSCTLISPQVFGPEGTCSAFVEDTGLGFKGSTTGFYGLINGYYDFVSQNSNINFFPYLGVGVGGALLQHSAQIQSNDQYLSLGNTPNISASYNSSNNGFAVQGILGFSSFLDDFTTLGIDFRYVSTVNFTKTTTANSANNSAYGISTLNLTATFILGDGQ